MIANIRLDKKTKTIKVVNRRYNIRLTHTKGQDIRLSHTGKRGPSGTVAVGSTTTAEPGTPASVTNSGSSTAAILDFTIPKGDKGDKGDTGVSTFVRSHHGSDQGVARPNALYVEWVGSVAPNNATTEDTWIKVPA
jgi:hypothetical protein